MHPYKRSARVSDLIRQETADIIMRKLKDPRLGFITVTEADVSDDLRHARVYVSVLEDAKKAETLKILSSSAKFIRGELGKRIKMKFIPSLAFKLDSSIEYGSKIDRIFDKIRSTKEGSGNNESSN
ncbi:MAG TPA: 30S ribosome-binding factor RbfA [Nitrospirae bacterium]|nr:ribosome-binding factor A [bacterium BMS3Abin10]HDH50461.1 30S ribosome-binding factor RbfA [Nitrospirota bacterium]HDK81164.1 30S ribosome-binding factor RbfA [Nitrospirota bacterium]